MTKDELLKALEPYPGNWEIFACYQPVVEVAAMEGETSDGPGSINIQGDGA